MNIQRIIKINSLIFRSTAIWFISWTSHSRNTKNQEAITQDNTYNCNDYIVHKVTIICWGPMLVNHRVEKNKKLKQMRNISQITGLFKKTRISHIKKTKISWFRSLLELIGDKICSLADLFKNNPDINRLKSNDVRSSHWDMESTYLRKYKNFAVTEILRR